MRSAKKNRPSKNKESNPECVFCRIAARQEEAKIVFEDAISVAFLDTRPLFHGHILLVSKQHYETLLDLPNDVVGPMFLNVQRMAATVQRVMKAEGTFVAMNNIVSQSVPHFHVHIVPRNRKDGLRGFFWPRRSYASEQESAAVQQALSKGASE
jgi:histidine triad (HIT) family protein